MSMMNDSTGPQDTAPHEWGQAVPGGEAPKSGDIIVDKNLGVAPEPLVGTGASSPLAEDESDSPIPPSPLWALKDRRHVQWHLLSSSERHERLRISIGEGDDLLYAIDDGRHHAMIGRRVGTSPSGVEYCLIGRVTTDDLNTLTNHDAALVDAFGMAHELMLCGVDQEDTIESSNVFDVARYESVEEIPTDYLPGASFHSFGGDLEITAY
jgi:hypothetical protein